jgi:hypothetical protein
MQATFIVALMMPSVVRIWMGLRQLARQAPQLCAVNVRRHSPRGTLGLWRVCALGSANFLFDKSQTPTMRRRCEKGLRQSFRTAKAKAVRDALDMSQMDPQWSRPSKMEENPMAWMIMVNGFVVDVRQMPRNLQEMAYEKGLIPYLPGDR